MYDSLDFDYTECDSIAASTDEIIWSDDDTIVADQEVVWQEGKKLVIPMDKNKIVFFYTRANIEIVTFLPKRITD